MNVSHLTQYQALKLVEQSAVIVNLKGYTSGAYKTKSGTTLPNSIVIVDESELPIELATTTRELTEYKRTNGDGTTTALSQDDYNKLRNAFEERWGKFYEIYAEDGISGLQDEGMSLEDELKFRTDFKNTLDDITTVYQDVTESSPVTIDIIGEIEDTKSDFIEPLLQFGGNVRSSGLYEVHVGKIVRDVLTQWFDNKDDGIDLISLHTPMTRVQLSAEDSVKYVTIKESGKVKKSYSLSHVIGKQLDSRYSESCYGLAGSTTAFSLTQAREIESITRSAIKNALVIMTDQVRPATIKETAAAINVNMGEVISAINEAVNSLNSYDVHKKYERDYSNTISKLNNISRKLLGLQ